MSQTILENIFVVMNAGIQKGSGKNCMNITDLTEDQQKHFCLMVDECVLGSEGDRELREGFKFMDELALKKGITFYDLLLQLYEKNEIAMRIEQWKEEKGIGGAK